MARIKYDVTTHTVDSLLAPSVFFEVPPFQRSYAWASAEINQFIEDIFSPGVADEFPYFLGSIVVANKQTDGDQREDVDLVLDGQQRLATLSLSIAALIQLLKDCGVPDSDAHDETQYLLTRVDRIKRPKLRLQKQDKPFFEALIVDPTKRSEKKIRRTEIGTAMELLMNGLKMQAQLYAAETLTIAYRKMVHRLTLGVEIVKISAPSEGDAFRLFETLNDRGLALSAADLVKNKIFARCGDGEIDDAIESWTLTLENVQDDDVVSFLRSFWTATRARVRTRRIYDVYKALLEKMEPTAAGVFALDLSEASEMYKHIINPIESTCPWGPDVARTLRYLIDYGAKAYRPMMLACALFLPKKMLQLAQLCETMIVRHTIIGEKSPSSFETLVTNVCKQLHTDKDIDVDKLEGLDEIPNDEEFRMRFIAKRSNKITRTHRTILERLNEIIGSGETRVADAKAVHVEHILPQKPTAKALKESKLTEDEAEELVNRFGNLTLWSGVRNREASNRPYSAKKDRYEKSEIGLTKELSKYPEWTASTIEERSKRLAELAVKAYPNPNSIIK